ncbi:MAG: 50S ribosomal protein L11 [Candidatus Thermoplasmatota archaeon]|nr:50S ribosomal protein L11 [Candidatus Thermoplasmatota archaeon]
MAQVLEILVDGGKATPGPPLGPTLGPTGVNIPQVVAKINEKTKAFEGMKVPIKLTINADRTFDITVGTPPASALLIKEAKAEKGSGKAKEQKVGNITLEQAKKVADMKKDALLGATLKARVKEIIGTCTSMGITVEGKEPKAILKEISEGKYDAKLKD